MNEGKDRHTVWLEPAVWDCVRQQYKSDNCTTHNEFIEKAIQFYTAYLNAQNSAAFLPDALSVMLTGTLDQFADRMGALLFKLTVEQNLCNHILATDTDIDAATYQKMRGKSVYEIKATNGRINFKDVLTGEKGV